MNFVPEFAPDAHSQWRDLEYLLQELVLDQIEILLSNPPAGEDIALADFFHDQARVRHHIFIRGLIDRRNNRITIVGVIHIPSPIVDGG